MIKDTRYIIKRVIIGVLISLALSFIYSKVKAESLSDLRISASYEYGINDSSASNSLEMDRFYNLSANQDLYLRVHYFITGVTISGSVYGRYTLCSSPDANWSGGWAVSNSADDIVFTMTKIPCNFIGSSFVGNIVFATYKGKGQSLYGTDSIEGVHIIASHTPIGGSIQLLAHEFSFNQFPTYYADSKVFDELDAILSVINEQNANDIIRTTNIINTINGNTNTITSAIATYTIPINQAINNLITAQSANTSTITNNATQNSQNEINAANQNTQETIESQKVCKKYNFDNNVPSEEGFLNSLGNISTSGSWYHTSDYIRLEKNKTYKLQLNYNGSNPSYCLYDINKQLINCTTYSNNRLFNITPNQDGFIRYSLNLSSSNITTFIGDVCYNGNQALQDTQEQTNNILTDDNVDDASSNLSEMDGKIATNSVISDLLLLPVTLFQNILNSINGTCSTFNIGSLYGTNLTLPCIDISGLIGSNLWGVIDILLCGIFVLSMRKRFVDIFENITSLKDRGNELE